MYSLLFFFIFVGCYLLYITSKKAKVGKVPSRLLQLAQPAKKAKIIASVIFMFSWAIIILDQGFGSGTFAFGGYIMAALSVVVLLNPLNYIRWTHLLGLFAFSIVFETFIF